MTVRMTFQWRAAAVSSAAVSFPPSTRSGVAIISCTDANAWVVTRSSSSDAAICCATESICVHDMPQQHLL